MRFRAGSPPQSRAAARKTIVAPVLRLC